jgi:hypothetical protein
MGERYSAHASCAEQRTYARGGGESEGAPKCHAQHGLDEARAAGAGAERAQARKENERGDDDSGDHLRGRH